MCWSGTSPAPPIGLTAEIAFTKRSSTFYGNPLASFRHRLNLKQNKCETKSVTSLNPEHPISFH